MRILPSSENSTSRSESNQDMPELWASDQPTHRYALALTATTTGRWLNAASTGRARRRSLREHYVAAEEVVHELERGTQRRAPGSYRSWNASARPAALLAAQQYALWDPARPASSARIFDSYSAMNARRRGRSIEESPPP